MQKGAANATPSLMFFMMQILLFLRLQLQLSALEYDSFCLLYTSSYKASCFFVFATTSLITALARYARKIGPVCALHVST